MDHQLDAPIKDGLRPADASGFPLPRTLEFLLEHDPGHAPMHPTQAWMDRVRMPGYKATIERVFVIHVEAFDWNCPQHITPRYTAAEIQEVVRPMEERLRALERENAVLRSRADASSKDAQAGGKRP